MDIFDNLGIAAQRAQKCFFRLQDKYGPIHRQKQRGNFVSVVHGCEIRTALLLQGDQQPRAVGQHLYRQGIRRFALLGGLLRRSVEPQLWDQRKQLQPGHQTRCGCLVARLQAIRFQLRINRHIRTDRAQLTAEVGTLLPLAQLLAHPFFDVDGIQIFVDMVDVVKAADQFTRTLGADARHAGDIIGAVALQRLDLDHLGRFHAVFLADFLGVVHRYLRLSELGCGKAHRDTVTHQLQAVAVPSGNHAFRSLLAAGLGQRAQNVVRLKSCLLHQRVAEQFQQFL